MRNAGGEAFVSRGTVHTMIGLVGDTERFQAIPFTQMRGRRPRDPGRQALQDGRTRPAPRGDDGEGGDHPGRPWIVHDHRRTVRGGVRGAGDDRARKAAKAAGATILRGDIYKPRTSPYSFQGLGERGLEILAECRRETGLPIIVEVVDVSQVEHVAEVADCIRVGTRNAQNFELLKEVGLTNKPVMLKRGLAMTIDEWLQAAEYVAQRGNSEIILCERGIRTFEPVHPQHARPGGHGGRPARVAPAGDRRSVARGGQATTWWRRWRWPPSRPAPTP